MAELTFDHDVEIDVLCDHCGNELTVSEESESSWNNAKINVEPCETCLEKAKEEAIEKFKEGLSC